MHFLTTDRNWAARIGKGKHSMFIEKTAFIDTEQAAARIGKSTSWLNHARQTGDGPPYRKIGRSVLYHVEDVDRWLESKVRTRVWTFDEKDREAKAAT